MRSSPFAVSPGDSITFSEHAISGDEGAISAEEQDNTNDGSVTCMEYGDFLQPGNVYTVICSGSESKNAPLQQTGPPLCGNGSKGFRCSKFTAVTFTNDTVDGQSLASWDPTQYDTVVGKKG